MLPLGFDDLSFAIAVTAQNRLLQAEIDNNVNRLNNLDRQQEGGGAPHDMPFLLERNEQLRAALGTNTWHLIYVRRRNAGTALVDAVAASVLEKIFEIGVNRGTALPAPRRRLN